MTPANPDSLAVETLVVDLLKATSLLLRRLRMENNPSELTLSQTTVLTRLQTHGATTTAELARSEGVRPQSMGATMASLEQRGLVERRPHPKDGRQALYDLTALGVALRDRDQLLKREWLVATMTNLDAEETQALTVALRVIRDMGAA